MSILELFDGVVEVHASAGDNFLGGEDFLDALVNACAADLKLDLKSLKPGEIGQLRRRLEKVKRDLSAGSSAHLDGELAGRQLDWDIDEERFAKLAEPLVQRMRTPLERAMRDSRLQPQQRRAARRGGPMRAPALKKRDVRLEEVILTDVCPYTLGTEVSKPDHNGNPQQGFFHPIIQRNSTVPISREDVFWPISDAQNHLRIEVYQGENPLVAKNIKLGEVSAPIPPRGDRSVRVRFTYDVNGILQVEVTVAGTGAKHELIVEQNPGVLSAQEIQSRLATLANIKIHPREKQENLALIARAERLYEENLQQREQIQNMLAHFRAAIESQDERMIGEHRRDFAKAMDGLEQL